MSDRTNPKDDWTIERLWCSVHAIEIGRVTVILHLGEKQCPDGRGAIELARMLCPNVEVIWALSNGNDTLYCRKGSNWTATVPTTIGPWLPPPMLDPKQSEADAQNAQFRRTDGE